MSTRKLVVIALLALGASPFWKEIAPVLEEGHFSGISLFWKP